MKIIYINTPFIKLGQLLKLIGLIQNGSEAKSYLESHEILVNEIHENRRGRKIFENDVISIENQVYKVLKGSSNV